MTRHDGALAALAAASGAIAIAFTWQPGLASLYDDSVFYLMMAQAMSPFGTASAAVMSAAPFDTYPPFLPLLLALGGGAFEWHVAHAIVSITFAISVLLLGIYTRQVTSSGPMGIMAALIYAVMPGTWLNIKGILSEFPYMALSFGTLVMHHRWQAIAPSAARAAVLGLLLAALVLTRTVGVALVAAIAVAETCRWWKERDRRRLVAAAVVIAVPTIITLLWIMLRPSSGQDAYAEFGARVADAARTGGGAWALVLLSANASALMDAWLNALLIFWGEWWRPKYLVALALGLSALAALAWRALRAQADALYCFAFVAILLAWPFPGQMYRLALPVMPIAIVALLWAWRELLLRYRPGAEGRAPWGAVLPLALCVPPTLFYIAERASAGSDGAPGARMSEISEFYRVPSGSSAALNATAQIGVFGDLRRIGATTPADARIMWYAPAYVALLSGRRAFRLERPANAAALEAQLQASGADYLYLAQLHPRDSARRLGHPLDPLVQAEHLARVLWRRDGPGGEPRGVLLEVDRGKMPETKTTP